MQVYCTTFHFRDKVFVFENYMKLKLKSSDCVDEDTKCTDMLAFRGRSGYSRC